MTDSQDEAVEDINERLESLIDEMSNTRSVTLLTALNTYPVTPHPCACPSVPQLLVKLALRYCFPDRLVLLFPYPGIPHPI